LAIRIRDWLRAFWQWVSVPSTEWFGLGAIAAVGFGVASFGGSADAFRFAGLILQLMGIASVGWGIVQTRRLFGHPRLAQVARAWLGRFPSWKPGPREASCEAATSARFSVEGYAESKAPPDATLEQRVTVLEDNLRRANDRMSSINERLKKKTSELSAELRAESQSRASSDRSLRQQLESASTGGLRLSAVGAIWLMVGVTMSTIPSELSALFGS